MDYEKRKQFVAKFKHIAKNIKTMYPKATIWSLNDVLSFMGFDYEHFSFKKECEEKGIECNAVRNLNSITHEPFFLGLKFDKEDFSFYKQMNDNTLKTTLNMMWGKDNGCTIT